MRGREGEIYKERERVKRDKKRGREKIKRYVKRKIEK